MHPALDDIANAWSVELHWQQRLGRNGIACFLVGNDGRRSAEVAALRDARRLKDRDGIAILALHFDGWSAIAAAIVPGTGQSFFEVVFRSACRFCGACRLFFGDEAAVGTGDRLFCGVPLHVPAAIGAGTLPERSDRTHSARNASRAAFVIRYCEPIFLALRPPSVIAAMTSASATPRNRVAAGSPLRSGACGGAPAAGEVMPPSFIICCAMPKPTASSAAVPPAPPAPLPIPWPI